MKHELDLNNLVPLDIDIPNIVPNISDFQRNMSAFDGIKNVNKLLRNCAPEPIGNVISEKLEPVLNKNQAVIEVLNNNYNELLKLNEAKQKELEEAKKEAKSAKRLNAIMLVLTVLSTLIALASWLIPNI